MVVDLKEVNIIGDVIEFCRVPVARIDEKQSIVLIDDFKRTLVYGKTVEEIQTNSEVLSDQNDIYYTALMEILTGIASRSISRKQIMNTIKDAIREADDV